MKDTEIIIIGDAGRGKTTFAEKLSEKHGIQKYSTDDFFWEVKFTRPRGREKDMEMAKEVFEKDEWIIEGGTRRMLVLGLEKADRIFYLKYKNFFGMAWVIFKRGFGRKNESLKNTFDLIVYQFKKRNKIGKHKDLETYEDMIAPYEDKVIRLDSFKMIDNYINSNY
jgi:adenylate kinase family enzyme